MVLILPHPAMEASINENGQSLPSMVMTGVFVQHYTVKAILPESSRSEGRVLPKHGRDTSWTDDRIPIARSRRQ